MTSRPKKMAMRLAGSVYRVLLYAYPADFRSRFGSDMRQVFGDQLRETFTQPGPLPLLRFCMRTIADLFASVLRERCNAQTLLAIAFLAAALALSDFAAHVDHRNATETYPTLVVVLGGSFVLGAARPGAPWRWAVILGLGVPFFGPLSTLPDRLISPGRWAMLTVLLIPGLIGAYTGSLLRRGIAGAH